MDPMEALPPETSLLTPYLTVTDASLSLDFYRRAFGFEEGEVATDPEGNVIHAEMLYQGRTAIMFAPEGDWSPMRAPVHTGAELPLVFYVYCRDVDALTERARIAGATVLAEPQDMFWGDRVARLRDPDGYLWTFAARVGEFDAEKIPGD